MPCQLVFKFFYYPHFLLSLFPSFFLSFFPFPFFFLLPPLHPSILNSHRTKPSTRTDCCPTTQTKTITNCTWCERCPPVGTQISKGLCRSSASPSGHRVTTVSVNTVRPTTATATATAIATTTRPVTVTVVTGVFSVRSVVTGIGASSSISSSSRSKWSMTWTWSNSALPSI